MLRQSLLYFALFFPVNLLASTFDETGIIRFLDQSSFGMTTQSLLHCKNLGSYEKCLADQFSQPISLFQVGPELSTNQKIACPSSNTPNCKRDSYTQYPNQTAFYNQALYNQDQLRLKLAWVLHQIFQISGEKIIQPSHYGPYLNLLKLQAFGNFRDLLEAITLNPAMGQYLDMVNNKLASTKRKTLPNENYAREILQLFSIGEYWLKLNGQFILDKNKKPIATYDQKTILEFAKVFTGWTYSDRALSKASKFPNLTNYSDPLVLYRDSKGIDTHHDKNEKLLLKLSLNGSPISLNAGQDGQKDLMDALDCIFNHPNVGPFIGKQLIQHLVTSNPSNSYVQRVSIAFNSGNSHGFGSGKRGDMQAVIAAVLLDEEARSLSQDTNFGLWREPVIEMLHTLRILNATSDGVLNSYSKSMGQDVFYSATVFNYYPHSYSLSSSNLQSPEFYLSSDSEVLARENFYYNLVFSSIKPDKNSSGTYFDIQGLQTLAANPSELVNTLNLNLLHGSMPDAMQSTLLTLVNSIPVTNLRLRTQSALYLILASGQYQVQR